MREMRIAIGTLMLALAACQPSSEPAPVVETPAMETQADAAPESTTPIVLGGVDFSKPARALGTEPFWGVEIRPDELVYSGVDRPETRMANPGPRMEGGAVVIPANAAGEAFTVTLRDADCSDGMSDRVYPLEAEVTYRGETLKGCAISQTAMDAGPRP
jgi:uncharacterized membrane protein